MTIKKRAPVSPEAQESQTNATDQQLTFPFDHTYSESQSFAVDKLAVPESLIIDLLIQREKFAHLLQAPATLKDEGLNQKMQLSAKRHLNLRILMHENLVSNESPRSKRTRRVGLGYASKSSR